MKDNVKDFEKKTRQRFAAQIDAIYSRKHGEFSNESIVKEVAELLSTDALSEFRFVLARRVVESEDNSRRAIPIPATIDMFDAGLLSSTILAIGGGLRVKLGDATFKHMLRKLEQQQDALTSAEASMAKWINVIETVKPIMEQDAALTLGACLQQIGVIKSAA